MAKQDVVAKRVRIPAYVQDHPAMFGMFPVNEEVGTQNTAYMQGHPEMFNSFPVEKNKTRKGG